MRCHQALELKSVTIPCSLGFYLISRLSVQTAPMMDIQSGFEHDRDVKDESESEG